MQTLLIIFYSTLLAATLKLADLVDEHGLKLFNGSKTLFGILWGISFIIITTINEYLAAFWIAFLIYWIINHKIDYSNHCLATAIIFLYYLWQPPLIHWPLLISTLFLHLAVYTYEKYLNKKTTIIIHYNIHLFLLLIILSITEPIIITVLLSFTVDSIIYHSIKHYAARHGYR